MKSYKEFYDYLRSKFSNLDECIKWYQDWKDKDQPDFGYGEFSLRVMAYHCSMVLERQEIDPGLGEITFETSYINTKYGSDIYWS